MSARNRRQAEIAIVRPAQPRTTPQAVAGATERRLPGALEVPLEQVVPDPGQPRRDWAHDDGEARLAELAASIREFGVLQPLLVREEGTLPDGRQRYVIIAGGRRRTAAERAGLALLPVVVRGEEAARVRILQLVENLQRQNLNPLDEARAYQELMDLEDLTPPALAARLHISAQHVRDRLRVLADLVLADAVERRQISATAAREIMKLPDDEVLTFRNRVLAGERLQTNDVAAARARLAAAGVVNPRRKRARPAGQEPPLPVDPQDAPPADGAITPSAAPPTPESGEQTSFGPAGDRVGGEPAGEVSPSAEARSQEQTTFVPHDGTTDSAGSPAPVKPPSAPPAKGLSGALVGTAERVAEALDRTLWGERRREVGAALDEIAAGPERVAWWLLVDAHLRERLVRDRQERPGGDLD